MLQVSGTDREAPRGGVQPAEEEAAEVSLDPDYIRARACIF